MKIRILISILLAIMLIGCKQGYFGKKPYPEFKLQSISNKTLNITKTKESLVIKNQTKPILFFFIDPSCNICFNDIEHMKRLRDTYKNQVDFIPVLAGSETPKNLYINEATIINQTYKIDFDFYFSTSKESFFDTFERQTNTNFVALYDSKLHLVQEYEGVIPEEMIEFDINQLLEKNGAKDVSKP